jgi:CBS-domain-containing membrane protein
MTRNYPALAHKSLTAGVRVATPPPPPGLTPESPALDAMTDLRRLEPASIAPHRTVVECNTAMIVRGVRLLFVEDAQKNVVGVITATDVLGEKPVRFMQERGVRHHEILVSDLMTPASALEALDLQDVSHAQVGQIVTTLRTAGRLHTFVTDDKGRRICGIFSATTIARRLGIDVPTHEVASSFAQIEAALAK